MVTVAAIIVNYLKPNSVRHLQKNLCDRGITAVFKKNSVIRR